MDPTLLWLWSRLVAVAPIQPLPWELPYVEGAALKKLKKKKKKKAELFIFPNQNSIPIKQKLSISPAHSHREPPFSYLNPLGHNGNSLAASFLFLFLFFRAAPVA